MKVKKVLLLTAAALLVYALVVHPTELGDGVRSVLGWITDGIDAVVTFLRSVAT